MRIRWLMGVLPLMALLGCGLKGPLYRPGEAQPRAEVAPASEPTSATTEESQPRRPRPAPQAQKQPQSDEGAGTRESMVPEPPVSSAEPDTTTDVPQPGERR
jgi:predicted small lipoprotein YifL